MLGTGDEKLSDAEKARRERTRTATRGVVNIDVTSDGRTVMVPLAGVFYLIDRASGTRRTIDPSGAAYDPHLSPDGAHIAFVRDGDLWIVETKPPADRFVFSRNPYFHRLDAQGRQLPYVDRVIFNIADSRIVRVKTGAGKLSTAAITAWPSRAYACPSAPGMAAMAAMSAPAEKAFSPPPVSTRTRTLGSSASRARAA